MLERMGPQCCCSPEGAEDQGQTKRVSAAGQMSSNYRDYPIGSRQLMVDGVRLFFRWQLEHTQSSMFSVLAAHRKEDEEHGLYTLLDKTERT